VAFTVPSFEITLTRFYHCHHVFPEEGASNGEFHKICSLKLRRECNFEIDGQNTLLTSKPALRTLVLCNDFGNQRYLSN